MVVKLKDRFVEADEVKITEEGIGLFIRDISSFRLSATGSNYKQAEEFYHTLYKTYTIVPFHEEISEIRYKISQLDFSDFLSKVKNGMIYINDYLSNDERTKKIAINDTYYRNKVYQQHFKKSVEDWIKDNPDSELSKRYKELTEKRKELIGNVKYENGYLDLSNMEYYN